MMVQTMAINISIWNGSPPKRGNCEANIKHPILKSPARKLVLHLTWLLALSQLPAIYPELKAPETQNLTQS